MAIIKGDWAPVTSRPDAPKTPPVAAGEYILLNDILGLTGQVWAVPLKDLSAPAVQLPLTQQLRVGLRRQIVEIDETGFILAGKANTQSPRFALWTPELVKAAYGVQVFPNGWCYNAPNPKYEETTPEQAAAMIKRLEAMCALLPFKVKVTAVQRRYLLYYSDGGKDTQQRYLRLAPRPGKGSPYTANWELANRFKEDHPSSGTPLLYAGPAWVTRFTVNGTDPVRDCRVYVDDEGRFICSDWCQRTGHSTYHQGIDLQVQGYTFDSWIAGPCMQKLGGALLPKGTKVMNLNQMEAQERQELDPGLFDSLDFVQAAYLSGARSVIQVIDMAKSVVWGGALSAKNIPVRTAGIEGRFSVAANAATGELTTSDGSFVPADLRRADLRRLDLTRASINQGEIRAQLEAAHDLFGIEKPQVEPLKPLNAMQLEQVIGEIFAKAKPAAQPIGFAPEPDPAQLLAMLPQTNDLAVTKESWGDGIEPPTIHVSVGDNDPSLAEQWSNSLSAHEKAMLAGEVATIAPRCLTCGELMPLDALGEFFACPHHHMPVVTRRYYLHIACTECGDTKVISGSVQYEAIEGSYPCSGCDNNHWTVEGYINV